MLRRALTILLVLASGSLKASPAAEPRSRDVISQRDQLGAVSVAHLYDTYRLLLAYLEELDSEP